MGYSDGLGGGDADTKNYVINHDKKQVRRYFKNVPLWIVPFAGNMDQQLLETLSRDYPDNIFNRNSSLMTSVPSLLIL